MYARKALGCVAAVLFFTTAFLSPDLARGGGFHGGGLHGGFSAFHGGGFHAGFPAFYGGGFHPGFREFHGFHDGHFREFHEGRFHHHGFHRGFVVVPAFGGWWWGGGWGWPYYSIHPEAITGTELMPGIGALIRRATTRM